MLWTIYQRQVNVYCLNQDVKLMIVLFLVLWQNKFYLSGVKVPLDDQISEALEMNINDTLFTFLKEKRPSIYT